MKRTLTALAAFGLALGLTAPARATDSHLFNCEKATVTELTKMSQARGKCITKCVTKKQKSPGTYSCRPPFDGPGGGSTKDCVEKTETKYGEHITAKCSGYMPTCGGYVQGWCGNNTSLVCNFDLDGCPIGAGCKGRCSATTSQSCDEGTPCPGVEACVNGSAKTIPGFIEGNLHDADSSGLTVLQQIDGVADQYFQCRQSVCTVSGKLCVGDGDCDGGADVCRSGKCSDNTPCNYDGECLTPTTKKCLALGRCNGEAKACTSDLDCVGTAPCLRWGRCTGTGNNPVLDYCINAADCPNTSGTCVRTIVDTDRKAEMKCTQAVSAALGKITFGISSCEAKCALERDVKLGLRCQVDTSIKCKVDADCPSGACRATSCDPFATGRCSTNQGQVCVGNTDCPSGETCVDTTPDPISKSLKDCRDKAFAKAVDAMNKKCPSMPVCGAYADTGSIISNFNTPQALIGFVNERQDKQFKEDNPDLSPGSNFCQP